MAKFRGKKMLNVPELSTAVTARKSGPSHACETIPCASFLTESPDSRGTATVNTEEWETPRSDPQITSPLQTVRRRKGYASRMTLEM